jgi:hypothetical protein
LRTDWSLSREKDPDGKRKDVMMTYRVSQSAWELRDLGIAIAYLLSASVNPFFGVTMFDPAAYLQSARPRSQSFSRCSVVSGSEHDYMAAFEVVFLIQFRVVCGWMF